MDFSEIFIIVILLIIGLSYMKGRSADVEYIKSSVDGRDYLVKNMPDKQKAADLLGSLNRDMMNIIKNVTSTETDSEERFVSRLNNYDEDSLAENASGNTNYTSYTVNKSKMVMCLRKRDGSNKLIEKNTLLYVMIHELAHVLTRETGHTPRFWKNFEFLLKRAVKLGIYKPVDYSVTPKPYCGMRLTSSILYK